MDMIVNACASVSGVWKKIAAFLPLLLGAGSVLSGLAGFCMEFGHAANAAALLKLAQGLQTDPNTALVLAGLAALGINTNHKSNAAVLADHAATIDDHAAILDQSGKA